VPALKSGQIVIADRYYYTGFARDVVRGADPAWVRKIYGFAIEPDLVFYLKMPLESLLRRIITTRGGLDFYESGRDIGMSTDLYQSFKLYQSHILTEYEHMVGEYGFKVVPADESVDTVQKSLRAQVRKLIDESHSAESSSHLNSSVESRTKVTGP
jgi:dTMP kinase